MGGGGGAPVLPAGITAGSQSLAGMTAEEAKAAVQQEYVDGLAMRVSDPQRGWTGCGHHSKGMGFHWINTDVIDEGSRTVCRQAA